MHIWRSQHHASLCTMFEDTIYICWYIMYSLTSREASIIDELIISNIETVLIEETLSTVCDPLNITDLLVHEIIFICSYHFALS